MLSCEGSAPGITALVKVAWPEAPDDALERYRFVVAVDAPLAFPLAFQRFLRGEFPEEPQPAREVDSILAYRVCDRHVALEHGKKTLSASFDKLGNNTTIAMVLTQQWRERHAFREPRSTRAPMGSAR